MLRAIVVGLGSMGQNHLRVLRAIDRVTVEGIVDSDPKRRAEFETFAGYSSIGEVPWNEIDFAIVSTPTSTHLDLAATLLDYGVNVLVEKPLCLTHHDAMSLVRAEQASSVMGAVGHIERFNPALNEMKQRISRGEIGDLMQISTRRQGPNPQRISDVGVVHDLAIHDIDLSMWLANSGYNTLHSERKSVASHKLEDFVVAVGSLMNGVIVNHIANWASPFKERSVLAIGSQGAFLADSLNVDLSHFEFGAQEVEWELVRNFRGFRDGQVTRLSIPKVEPLRMEQISFIDAIEGGENSAVSFEEAARAIEVAEMMLN